MATTVGAATEFLYTGSDPIQTGVAPGTILPVRAAVVRGRALDRMDNPLPAVTVTVLGHPEFGRTLTRADGMFDLAVNGGGRLTLVYSKQGFLGAQRGCFCRVLRIRGGSMSMSISAWFVNDLPAEPGSGVP